MRISVDDSIRIERDEQGALVSVHASGIPVEDVESIVVQPEGGEGRVLVTVEYNAGEPAEHCFYANALKVEEV